MYFRSVIAAGNIRYHIRKQQIPFALKEKIKGPCSHACIFTDRPQGCLHITVLQKFLFCAFNEFFLCRLVP